MDSRKSGNTLDSRSGQRGDRTLAAFAAVAAGLLLFLPGLDGLFDGFSFDLLFRTRFARQPTEVVMVSLDAETFEDLNAPKRSPLNRTNYVRLLNRLAAAGAKAVVFDMVFDDALPEEDAAFGRALRGMKCVIGAEYFHATRTDKARLILPVPALRETASAWGLVNLELQEGWTARSYRLWENLGDIAMALPNGRAPSLALAAWEVAGYGSAAQLSAPQRVWLNYYGSRDTLDFVSFSDALDPRRAPDKGFANKVVFVGSRLSIGNPGTGKDEFATPYSLFDHSATHGMEIHATAFQNLLQREWLTRTPLVIERTGIVLLAAIFGALFIQWPPYRGMLVALLATMIVVVLAWYGFVWRQVWFAWVKVVVVLAAAYGWAVVYNLYRAHLENALFRRIISGYFSPSIVEMVLKDPKSILKPHLVWRDAAYLFADMANSMEIAERNRKNPQAVIREWNAYCELAAAEIHAQDGMLAKFLGDGFFAMWNVPFDQADFRRRALTAAVGLKERIGRYHAASLGAYFHTRIGVHCGESNIGNAGSRERFEYTALGLEVGTAARLEAANKKFGTQLIASDATVVGLEGEFRLREIGHCQLKGVTATVRLFEVLGFTRSTPRAEWLEAYEAGLRSFRAREFANARAGFLRTLALREDDKPAAIYLREIDRLEANPPPLGWAGERLDIS